MDQRGSFLEAINAGPLVLDAGMGTRLMALGLDPRSDDPVLWNLGRPGDVLAIHRRDVAAGSGAILTNTFGANRFWLRKFGQAWRGRVDQSPCRRAGSRGRGPGPVCDRRPGPDSREWKREPRSSRRRSWSTPAPMPSSSKPIASPRRSGVLRDVSRSLAAPIPLLASLWEWPDPPGRPPGDCSRPGRP